MRSDQEILSEHKENEKKFEALKAELTPILHKAARIMVPRGDTPPDVTVVVTEQVEVVARMISNLKNEISTHKRTIDDLRTKQNRLTAERDTFSDLFDRMLDKIKER